jgi:hypothetical protein
MLRSKEERTPPHERAVNVVLRHPMRSAGRSPPWMHPNVRFARKQIVERPQRMSPGTAAALSMLPYIGSSLYRGGMRVTLIFFGVTVRLVSTSPRMSDAGGRCFRRGYGACAPFPGTAHLARLFRGCRKDEGGRMDLLESVKNLCCCIVPKEKI